jgi:hypothetical protein
MNWLHVLLLSYSQYPRYLFSAIAGYWRSVLPIGYVDECCYFLTQTVLSWQDWNREAQASWPMAYGISCASRSWSSTVLLFPGGLLPVSGEMQVQFLLWYVLTWKWCFCVLVWLRCTDGVVLSVVISALMIVCVCILVCACQYEFVHARAWSCEWAWLLPPCVFRGLRISVRSVAGDSIGKHCRVYTQRTI